MKKTYLTQIDASHPMMLNSTDGFDADMIAMKLVGEQHDKRELINLVRWLILDKASTVRKDIGL